MGTWLDRVWVAPVVAGVAATALCALGSSDAVTALCSLVVGLTAAVAFFAGPRLHPAAGTPWNLLGTGCLLFLVSLGVRPAGQDGYGTLAGDAVAISGYALLAAGLVALLRARGSLERHAVTDGVIVCLGAGLLSVTLLTLPAAERLDRPALVTAVAGAYPILDLVLLLVVVNLAFTTAARNRSYSALCGAVVLLMIGDLGFAWSGAYGRDVRPFWLALPYLLSFTLFAVAALHPSMVDLARALPRTTVQAWSRRRLALLVPALAVPFVLVATVPGHAARVLVALAGAGMVAALLVRATSAVAAYARVQEVFRFQATHDPLTGLPNRAALVATADRLLADPREDDRAVWLFFLDLDGFSMVNDSWGHDAGDRVIAEVAHRLRLAAPPAGTLARLSGDEFVLVLPAHRNEAEAAADTLLGALADPLELDGTEVLVSASIGLATGSPTAEALLRDADTAMYQAKSGGRRCRVVFDPAMRRDVRDRVELELSLRHALAHGGLRVAYQPIVRVQGGAVLGAEALVRWRHPVRGPVPPSAFIPIAEEAGLIADLGELVLLDALRWTATWRRAGVVGEDFWMSVNVSTRQLRDDRIVRTVRRELAANGLPASALTLEITESVVLDESAVTQRVLRELRALGVRLVVDDFGTGFSALGYLRRHPVTGVKIDRSFVDGLGRDSEDEEIVRAVVAMASALGLSVVAEGVELAAQRDVLAEIGVEHGQGYLWGHAVEPAEFAVLPVTAQTRLTDELMAPGAIG